MFLTIGALAVFSISYPNLKAESASDLPPCNREISISNTATISNNTFIIHLLEFCFRQIDIVDISRCFTAEKDNQDGGDLCLVVH